MAPQVPVTTRAVAPVALVSDDAQLLAAAASGDRSAFDELMDRHEASVFRFCLYMLGDEASAADLTQDVFVKVFRAAHTYRPTAAFGTWLMRIARNACLNELRRRRRHPTVPLEDQRPDGTGRAREFPGPGRLQPDRRVEDMELRAAVRAAVAALPTDQRTVVTLSRFQEMPYEEIARVMGKSVPAIKSLMHRAKLALADSLEGYG